MREICICETPTSSPISRCVIWSTNRRRSTCHSRSSSSARRPLPRPRPGHSRLRYAKRPTKVSDPSSCELGVERPRAPGVNGLDSVEHVLDRDVKARRDLGRGRMAPELLGETVGRTVDPHRQLPQASRQPSFQT